MSFSQFVQQLAPFEKAVLAALPIAGIFIGWLLKTFTDVLLRKKDEWGRRRKCVFYFLRSWKRILDYERYVSLNSKRDLDVVEFERVRSRMFQILLRYLGEGKESMKEGIRELAVVDPTAAVQIDNTLHNFFMLEKLPLGEISNKDPAFYLTCMSEHYKQIDWTLSDLSVQTKKLAGKSGPFQKRRISKWYEARMKGKSDFEKGVEDIESDYEIRSEPPKMTPLVMPDYISADNWKNFIDSFPVEQQHGAPEYNIAAQNLEDQIHAFKEQGVEVHVMPVEFAEWSSWVNKNELERRHESVGQYAMFKYAQQQTESDEA